MGPIDEYDQNIPHYNKKQNFKERIVWADEKGFALAQEEWDEYIAPKPAPKQNKRVPFGPKYTGEGKLDFYMPNNIREGMDKEDIHDMEAAYQIKNNRNRVDANQNVFADITEKEQNKAFVEKSVPNGGYNRITKGYNPQPAKVNMFVPQTEELDSRNDVFLKSGTDPAAWDRKPASNLNVQVPKSKPRSTVAAKSKNLHNKINRGISPNQPPQSKAKPQEEASEKKPASKSSQQINPDRRSSSLKVKKEHEKMVPNKPGSSKASHRGQSGGSFVVPSNTPSLKKSESSK